MYSILLSCSAAILLLVGLLTEFVMFRATSGDALLDSLFQMLYPSAFETKKYTIVGGVLSLWEHGDRTIACVVGLASILLPVSKCGLLLWLSSTPRTANTTHGLDWLKRVGRWSMLDIFLVALLVLAVKSVTGAEIAVGMAFWSFLAHVIVSAIAIAKIHARTDLYTKE